MIEYKVFKAHDYDHEAIEEGLLALARVGWRVVDSWTIQGAPEPDYDPQKTKPPLVFRTLEGVTRAFLLERES